MGKVKMSISMSLDGYVSRSRPERGESTRDRGGAHEWVVPFGLPRGPRKGRRRGEREHADRRGDPRATWARSSWAETCSVAAGTGATTLKGWWGDNPALPHRGLRSHPPCARALELQGGTTFYFVTDGIESALEQARAAAGDLDVSVGGGAGAAQQYLASGLLDGTVVSIVPVIRGGGASLFDNLGDPKPKLEQVEAIEVPGSHAHQIRACRRPSAARNRTAAQRCRSRQEPAAPSGGAGGPRSVGV